MYGIIILTLFKRLFINAQGIFMKEKFVSTNELANDASKILRNLKKGESTVILRYSAPVGVLISYEDYKMIENLEMAKVSECKACLGVLKKGGK